MKFGELMTEMYHVQRVAFLQLYFPADHVGLSFRVALNDYISNSGFGDGYINIASCNLDIRNSGHRITVLVVLLHNPVNVVAEELAVEDCTRL